MMVSHLKIEVCTPKLSHIVLMASILTLLGLVFGAQNEYQPNSAAWLQSKPPPSMRRVADTFGYWRVNTQKPLTPAFPMYQPQQHNWSPHVEPGPREELNWVVPQQSVSFGHLENLPQAPYLQFPPTSSETNNHEDFTNRTSPPGAKPYMHGILTGDPNSIAVSGSTIGSSHISDPISDLLQLPSSSAPQPWRSVPQYGYMETSAAPAAEVFNSWFPNNPNMPLNPQAGGDNMSYDSVYYNDTAQARRQQ
jgi:hypothetical protein